VAIWGGLNQLVGGRLDDFLRAGFWDSGAALATTLHLPTRPLVPTIMCSLGSAQQNQQRLPLTIQGVQPLAQRLGVQLLDERDWVSQ
jgi:hypothetical protein